MDSATVTAQLDLISPELITPEIIDSAPFDYGALDLETRITTQQRTSEIKSLMKRTAQANAEIGEKLIEVKALLEYGLFCHWIEAEFGWGRTTAHRYMRVYEAFGGSNLEQLAIAPSAAYILASPSTPDSVRESAIKLATSGTPVTHAQARQMVTEAKQEQRSQQASTLAASLEGKTAAQIQQVLISSDYGDTDTDDLGLPEYEFEAPIPDEPETSSDTDELPSEETAAQLEEEYLKSTGIDPTDEKALSHYRQIALKVGKLIRDYREDCGNDRKMTQQQLADAIFISRQYISLFETGRVAPNIAHLVMIAKALGKTLDDFDFEKQERLRREKAETYSIRWHSY